MRIGIASFFGTSPRRDFGFVYLEHAWRHEGSQQTTVRRRARALAGAVQEELG